LQNAERKHVRRESFFELRSTIGGRAAALYGLAGAIAFFLVWEIGHHLTPDEGKRFLPSPQQVVATLAHLITERGFLGDVAKSVERIFLSFFFACLIALPLGLMMGCFARMRALLNPTLSGWRYLPAASFIPLLLVWFGPTDLQKLALLFMGVVFFLIALILDNVESVPKEYVESALTMGASRSRVVLSVVLPAAAPSIVDSMRNMIAVGWTYLVIAEIVAAHDGIGAVMMRAGRFLNVDVIMAGILTIGILGVLTDMMFRFGVRLFMPWTRERRG
jgi:NitT/TauT family transport system permease protein